MVGTRVGDTEGSVVVEQRRSVYIYCLVAYVACWERVRMSTMKIGLRQRFLPPSLQCRKAWIKGGRRKIPSSFEIVAEYSTSSLYLCMRSTVFCINTVHTGRPIACPSCAMICTRSPNLKWPSPQTAQEVSVPLLLPELPSLPLLPARPYRRVLRRLRTCRAERPIPIQASAMCSRIQPVADGAEKICDTYDQSPHDIAQADHANQTSRFRVITTLHNDQSMHSADFDE